MSYARWAHRIIEMKVGWLKSVTAYRLITYFLSLVIIAALLASRYDLFGESTINIFSQVVYLLGAGYLLQLLLTKLFRFGPSWESSLITILILSLIIEPSSLEFRTLLYLTLALVLALGSKLILTHRGRPIFNPAAFGVVIGALLTGQTISWWVGSRSLVALVIVGGLLVVWKVKRFRMVATFLSSYILLSLTLRLILEHSLSGLGQNLIAFGLDSPILFFSLVMLVEPTTSPKPPRLQVYYGLIVACSLVILQIIWPGEPAGLVLALFAGNIFNAYMRHDMIYPLKVKTKIPLTPNIIEFQFVKPDGFIHKAGQYMHLRLAHPHPDSRGVRRYFTIAASPTENIIRVITKFSPHSSSFKRAMKELKPDDYLSAFGIGGDFVLPNKRRPLVFIAGGIGITPFISIIKYCLDSKTAWPITLFYATTTVEEQIYPELLIAAQKSLDLKFVPVIGQPPSSWSGEKGFIDNEMIERHVPDLAQPLFYVSGPEPMVELFEKMLAEMGVNEENLKRDFFPGYTETYQETTEQ